MREEEEYQERLEAVTFFSFLSSTARSIKCFFKRIFQFLFSVLIFLFHISLKRYYIILFMVTTFLAFGGYSLYKNGTTYYTNYIVRLSFNSGLTMYDLIQKVNDLSIRKDFEAIAKLLDISYEEAHKIYGFEMIPINDGVEKARYYQHYLNEVDTSYYEPTKFEDYIDEAPPHTFPFQNIVIYSAGKADFKKIQDKMIAHVNKADFFNEMRKVNGTNLAMHKNNLLEVNQQLDSLDKIRKIALLEGSKISHKEETNYYFKDILGSPQGTEEWIYERKMQNSYELGKLNNYIEVNKKLAYAITDAHEGTRESRTKFLLFWVLKALIVSYFIILSIELFKYLKKKQREFYKN